VRGASAHGTTHAAQPCQTCGDLAEPMRVLGVDQEVGLALCLAEDGRELTVDTALLGEVLAGESLLVHAGAALARIGGERP